MSFLTSNSILQKLDHPTFTDRSINLYVKRDDLIHAEVSGNKWRKLKYNFEQFRISKKDQIITFGGAYSNHLLATASACNEYEINSIGIVRGEELTPEANKVLQRCSDLGMELQFISRMEYGMRNDKEYLEEISIDNPNSYIIPEGGANYLGVIGCQEIMDEVSVLVDHVFVAQGTSTTSCGLLLSNKTKSLHVVPALKGYDSYSEMANILNKSGIEKELVIELLSKLTMHCEAHFGGYGKVSEELLEFIAKVDKEMNLPLDKIYTGKAFFALMNEVENGNFDNQNILFIHTGGLYSLSSESGQ